MKHYLRSLDLEKLKLSAFLFGPRMTGKSTLLETLSPALLVDLLNPEIELSYQQTPQMLWNQLQQLPPDALVILDEIQRVPKLLDYVQMAIQKKGLRFILSGSSARKLKRQSANLLGGRALDLRLHPLTHHELGRDLKIDWVLQYGTLPLVYSLLMERDLEAARGILKSYVTTYVRQEIQYEALVRNIGPFQRFLSVAAQSNGTMIEFANIGREASVPASTVKEFFEILEDTLIGRFLWQWHASERKKARPKFYFFDCGVVRAIQQRLTDAPTPSEKGILFESWLIQELLRLRDYSQSELEFCYWRDGMHEIDLLILRHGKPYWGIEIKLNAHPGNTNLMAFRKAMPKVRLSCVTLEEHASQKTTWGEILSWKSFLKEFV